MKRVILIVLDSLGIGALPDGADYGDLGANTLRSIKKSKKDLHLPHLIELGLGNIDGVEYLPRIASPLGSYARLSELSKGKDTITGHWEIAGLYTEIPFKTYRRFPDSFIKAYEEAIGIQILGNYAASGTEIIRELGPEHKATGKPIIYTSADSVFQIAADMDVIPLERLYDMCKIARKMLVGEISVGRVIARPFVVRDGEYIRTADRKDYAVSPPDKTLLDYIKEEGKTVYAVGKINDIFNGQGISTWVHTEGNQDGVDKTIKALSEDFSGLIFTNLVDFDSKYGHRRDGVGYGVCLEEFDNRLPEIMQGMKDDDLLILCADHGNDPGYKGWDHTREYVPLLIYGKRVKAGVNLGTGESFANIAATAAEYLGVKEPTIGQSYLQQLLLRTEKRIP